MKGFSQFDLNVDQVAKINKLLPKGYKLISIEDNTKRVSQLKKKPKIALVPLAQVIIEPPVGRRNKTNISYYEGDEPLRLKSQRSQFQSQKSERAEKPKIKKQPWEKQMPTLKKNQSIQLSFPLPIFNKVPLSPKQILQQLQSHYKFNVIKQFMNDFPEICTYGNLMSRSEQPSYGLHDLLNDMSDLFIKIYGSYSKNSDVYRDAGQLEGYLTTLINAEKGKLKEPKPEKQEKPKQIVKEIPIIFKQQVYSAMAPPLVRAPSQLLKKKTVPAKTQIKNITITDKRILGQNIKKLQSDYLPEICKIVYDTLETREQYVIDIDTLPLKKVKQLQNYVANCLNKLDVEDQGNDIKNQVDESQSSFIIMDDYSD